MADKKKKKGIFSKAVDAVSSRDEKQEISNLQEELEKAKKEADAAKEAIKSVMNKNVETTKGKVEAEKDAQKAEERIKELEAKLNSLMDKDRERLAKERQDILEERRQKIEESQKPNLITTHTVESGETLSHVALKYYKHATPPYWKLLLEHNKEVLKGDEKNVRTGMELEIPELPDNLKD
jgi:nucleoid-associated protein YgaU